MSSWFRKHVQSRYSKERVFDLLWARGVVVVLVVHFLLWGKACGFQNFRDVIFFNWDYFKLCLVHLISLKRKDEERKKKESLEIEKYVNR